MRYILRAADSRNGKGLGMDFKTIVINAIGGAGFGFFYYGLYHINENLSHIIAGALLLALAVWAGKST
jgi:hypothetical protein